MFWPYCPNRKSGDCRKTSARTGRGWPVWGSGNLCWRRKVHRPCEWNLGYRASAIKQWRWGVCGSGGGQSRKSVQTGLGKESKRSGTQKRADWGQGRTEKGRVRYSNTNRERTVSGADRSFRDKTFCIIGYDGKQCIKSNGLYCICYCSKTSRAKGRDSTHSKRTGNGAWSCKWGGRQGVLHHHYRGQ